MAYAATRVDRFIVVNESWRLHRAADVLYAADCRWWQNRAPPPRAFTGERWTTPQQWTPHAKAQFPGMFWAETKAGRDIVSNFPICTGHNSAFQAMGLAVLWGASRIVFLGLDLKTGPDGKDHWFGNYEKLTSPRSALGMFREAFTHAAPQLTARGIEVVNASRDTALECFPRISLEASLALS